MDKETIIYDKKGKVKMRITRSVTGEDKMREAVLFVMGPGYEYMNEENEITENQK